MLRAKLAVTLVALLLIGCRARMLHLATPTPTRMPTATAHLSATASPVVTAPSTALRTMGEAPTATVSASTSPTASLSLSVSSQTATLMAGSSATLDLTAESRRDGRPAWGDMDFAFSVDNPPKGITTELMDTPVPSAKRLIVHTSGLLAPGVYTTTVTVAKTTPPLVASQSVNLAVMPCRDFEPGVFSQSVDANLVTLQTSGKPSIEHGLLVPLQVCGGDEPRRLTLTLDSATSAAGTTMETPPRFYVHRSLVWPAPQTIDTHDMSLVNASDRVESAGWDLATDVRPGLYLLVFERDRYSVTPVPPVDVPASVTYRVEISPSTPLP
jgi:hypothetical protein